MVIIRNFAFTYPMFYAKTIQRLMERHQIMTRRATVGDLPGIKELFRRAVAGVSDKYYNNEEKPTGLPAPTSRATGSNL